MDNFEIIKEYDDFFRYLVDKWYGKLEYIHSNELENNITNIIKVSYQIPKNVFSIYSIDKLTKLRQFIQKNIHLITVRFILIGAELSEKELPNPFEIGAITNDHIQPIIQEVRKFKNYCSEEEKQQLQFHLDQLFKNLIDYCEFCVQLGKNHNRFQDKNYHSIETSNYIDKYGKPLNQSSEEVIITFYDATNCAVYHPIKNFEFLKETNNISQEFFNEIFLLSCFTIRQLRNLSLQSSGGALAHELKTWDMNEIINQLTINSNINKKINFSWGQVNSKEFTKPLIDKNNLENSFTNNIFLVPFVGLGNKKIILKFINRNNQALFILKTKGFGLFGEKARIEINKYMPASVFALFTFYLSISYKNEIFLTALKYVATQCANEYFEKTITMENQEYLALVIAIEACEL